MSIRGELRVTMDGEERAIPLDAPRLTIGRDETADLCLAQPMVSRLHAEIIRLGDDFLLRDSGSTNGSYVNDIRVAERLLADGDQLRFGKAGPELVFHLVEVTAPLAAVPAVPPGTTENLVAALSARLGAPGCPPVEEASLRCLLAETYLRKGRADSALAVLGKYADGGAALQSLPLRARADVERWLGSAYNESKQYKRAAETVRSALTLSFQANDQNGLAEAHAVLGRALIGLDDMLAARDHLHRASLLARQADNQRVRAEAHLQLGRVDWKESDFEGARYNWSRAARLAESITDDLLKARASMQHAFILYAEGDLERAVPAYQEAVEQIERVGNVRLLLKAYASLSRVLTRKGSWLATERLLERRLELARAGGLAKAEAVALTDLAELRLLQGKSRAASKVIAMAVARHGHVVYARTQRILGRILLAEGRTDESVRELERGLEAARAKGALDEQILLGLELAVARLDLGDVAGAAAAVDAAEATTPLDPALGLLARERYTRGLVLQARGQLADANRALAQAMSIFSTTGDPYRVALCHLAIGRLRSLMGRPESGRAHLEMARDGFAQLGAAADLERVVALIDSPEYSDITASMTRPLSQSMGQGLLTVQHSTQLATRTVEPTEVVAPASPYRVLLAVSDAALGDLLTRGLEVENFVVDRAEHGREALGAAVAEPRIHDIFLLDALLEHSSGFDVCRELRRRTIETPVVLLGSRPGIEDKIEALQVGADDYVYQRSFVFEELLAKLEALLR